MTTLLDACLEATDEIWDDREGYLRTALHALRLDPEYDYERYLDDIRGFGLRIWPAQVRDA